MSRTAVGSFVTVCAALLTMAAGNHLVAPLYPVYQTRFTLSTSLVTVVAAMFGSTLIPTMLVAGPLSDRWGRRPLMWVGVGAFLLGDVAFAMATGIAWLLVGRMLQGVGMGAFFGPSTALASDLVDARRKDLAALGATVASMVGFGLGPFFSGLLIQSDLAPQVVPFLVHGALLVVSAVMLGTLPHPLVDRGLVAPPGPQGGMNHPVARRIALLGGFSGWALGGLLLVMLPTILRPLLGRFWGIGGGAALLGLMLAGGVAQILTRGWHPTRALLMGSLTQAGGFLLLQLGLGRASVPLVAAAVLLIGLGLATLQRGGLGLTIRATPEERKGDGVSRFLACAYFGGNFPVILFGVAADRVGFTSALWAYFAVFGSLLVVAAGFLLLRRGTLP